MISRKISKRSQVTIFIILAAIIVSGLAGYFLLRGNLFASNIPQELRPVYDYYLDCVDQETLNGVSILGQTGGYIEHPEFSPGSVYMPFSNELGFLGYGIPYWYYISGNGVSKQQVPSKENMQQELNKFLLNRMRNCDFSQFAEKGFYIVLGNPNNVNSVIEKNIISVNLDQDITIRFENTSWTGNSHNKIVKSNLGKFYDIALKIYNSEKEKMFLENYGVDVLRAYAPVDGVELQCNPKIWKVDNVREDLMNALEANIGMIKVEGDYYKLSNPNNKYFIQDIGEKVDANVQFLYSRNWPMKMEIWPSKNGNLQADPIGTQEGLGILGFCYVPYHFTYDLGFPVLIQIFYDNEIFQFPMVVFIDKNTPRNSSDSKSLSTIEPELCKYRNSELMVSTFNSNLNPVKADIEFKCFDNNCYIGRTDVTPSGNAVLIDKFPQCVNGYVVAKAPGYKTSRYMIKSLDEKDIQILMDKAYRLNVEVNINNNEYALINFNNGNESIAIQYPDQKQVELAEGQYKIQTYIYSDSDINVGNQQIDDVDISQISSFAVSGGGIKDYYISETELSDSKKIVINAVKFGSPSRLEDLQDNYNKINTNDLEISFQ